jgi:glycosyltransferase involved in cell wall biosynthesis
MSKFLIKPKYVLVTSARNEEQFIETSIKSVISQTILPLKWVIVSDGSTDRTVEIVNEYSLKFDFIKPVPLDSINSRNFASKVKAIKAGLAKIKNEQYDFIGNLDADTELQNDYYEKIMKKFMQIPELGVAGGKIYELVDGKLIEDFSSSDSVGGIVQFFRKECYKQIGGYLPLRMGGEDTIAEVMSRMYGWKVKKFSDLAVIHCRPTGSAQDNKLVASFKLGLREFLYGTLPLFEVLKCARRVVVRPYVLGSILRFYGYIWGSLFEKRQHLPKEVIQFIRDEQKQKIISLNKKLNPFYKEKFLKPNL